MTLLPQPKQSANLGSGDQSQTETSGYWHGSLRGSPALVLSLLLLLAGNANASPAQLVLTVNALGQQSLLDLDDAPEEPQSEKSAAEGTPTRDDVSSESDPLPEEMPGLPPVVSEGIGRLDDLLGEEGGKSLIESEQVCDMIRQTASGHSRILRVKMLRRMIQPPLAKGRPISVMRLDDSGKRPFRSTIPPQQIDRVMYYEQRMLHRVAEEMGEPRNLLTRFDSYLDLEKPAKMKQARRAIALLTIALAEHDSARERLIREGDEWNDLRFPLAQALFRLEVSRVKLHFDKGQLQQAVAACDRLLQQPDLGVGPRKLIRQLFDDMLLKPGVTAAEQGDFATGRDALQAFGDRYSSQPSRRADRIRELLEAASQKVVERAVAEKNPKLLDQAAEIWPHLEGLENLRRQMLAEYPVLHCAYAALPKSFSPLSARTPAERHATALLFESLVRWRKQSKAGAHYASYLATTRPLPLARGREFRLPRAHWSDSDVASPHYCTTEDVLWTVRLMKNRRPLGFPAAWGRLVKDVTAAESHVTDPFRVSIFLENDHWQPLSLMDFPILPKASFPTCGENEQELERFSQHPIGTGPYLLRDPGGTGRAVRFVANPFYRNAGQPFIREIQFHQLDSVQGRDAFLRGDVDLMFDVSPAHVVELRKFDPDVIKKLPTRSLYFLAPNHRRKPLQNADLRLAIAHAIDRQKILDANYRPGTATRDHAALNGPFPTRSWAFNPEVPDYATGSAATFAAKARQQLGPLPKLRLMYPDRHQETGNACNEIQRQLQAIGIEIELEPTDPNAFVRRVVEEHSYDLAYWRHDYKDETYWLWPLLNPSDAAPGGANFMGYVPDDQLQDLCSRVLDHKMFRTIRATTHEIHRFVSRQAIMIPLWELDTYVAARKSVQGARFSTQTLFDDVDSWKLSVE